MLHDDVRTLRGADLPPIDVIVGSPPCQDLSAANPRAAGIDGMTKEIRTSEGAVVLVDAADFDWLNQWRWHLNSRGYAVRRPHIKGEPTTILMHRLIMQPQDGEQIDHINRDKLDNRRANLRIATRSENHLNRALSPRNKSGAKGVRFDPRRQKWCAEIRLNGRSKTIGRFPTFEEARNARVEFERANGILA